MVSKRAGVKKEWVLKDRDKHSIASSTAGMCQQLTCWAVCGLPSPFSPPLILRITITLLLILVTFSNFVITKNAIENTSHVLLLALTVAAVVLSIVQALMLVLDPPASSSSFFGIRKRPWW